MIRASTWKLVFPFLPLQHDYQINSRRNSGTPRFETGAPILKDLWLGGCLGGGPRASFVSSGISKVFGAIFSSHAAVLHDADTWPMIRRHEGHLHVGRAVRTLSTATGVR
ncbi:hypothetical protein M0R45_014794 [Rubus argutus]|uniref:Uncharacterized protein n=1 Tax=Rubus argutus TaxID=59490 RepID=A0AAW1XN79_RUBAR